MDPNFCATESISNASYLSTNHPYFCEKCANVNVCVNQFRFSPVFYVTIRFQNAYISFNN
ncbi:hypothetical protein THF1C08_250066 [Vibrio jasicida]|nr:hypothetical protein THF1C08_250066 [Vibrio jasicida]